jgi:hypothetical protein
MANKQRDPRLEAFWRNVLAKFRDSGLSVRAFCREQKLTEPAFYAWRRVIRERDAQPAGGRGKPKRRPVRPSFVPLAVCDTRSGGEGNIIVELRGERMLRLPLAISAERLAELVGALETVVSDGGH